MANKHNEISVESERIRDATEVLLLLFTAVEKQTSLEQSFAQVIRYMVKMTADLQEKKPQ